MMIENALGYFNADPGYQYSREEGDEVCLSPLWPLGPPILGGSRSFSRFPPLSHITRPWSHTGRCICVCHDVMPRCILVPRDTRPVSPASDDEPPGTDIMAPDTRDVLKSARGHNECLLLTSLSPRFLLLWLSGYQILKPGNIWRPPAHYPWITTKHFFWQRGQLLQFFYTGIERFLFVWLALHRHITEKRAADWSRGGSPLSNHCHKAELPGSRSRHKIPIILFSSV